MIILNNYPIAPIIPEKEKEWSIEKQQIVNVYTRKVNKINLKQQSEFQIPSPPPPPFLPCERGRGSKLTDKLTHINTTYIQASI